MSQRRGNLFVSPKGLILDGDEQSEVEVKDESKKISPARAPPLTPDWLSRPPLVIRGIVINGQQGAATLTAFDFAKPK